MKDSSEETLRELSDKAGSLNILHIDDDSNSRELMSELLREYFGNVDSVRSGREGLEKYNSFYEKNHSYYNLVVTDIEMSDLDGLSLIKEIKKANERQIIIVQSANSSSSRLLQLIDLEVIHFIPKPIEEDRFRQVLIDAVKILLHRREFKSINDDLARAKIIAEKADEQKSRFLANMSHEIRTPLSAIIGFIKLLEENETDDTKQKYLKIIKNSSESLLQIINDILDLSKIECGKLNIEPYNFNPYEDLIMIAELFQAKAAEKKIVFQIRYNNYMPQILYGDALRIKQIFSNLLSNAIKFTPESSKVKCVIWYKNGYLNIKVKDYGIGISEEKQKVIFESFAQADTNIARVYGGTGLGLSISLELAKLLGGDLRLKSRLGKGSIFTLSIPIEQGKEIKDSKNEHNKLPESHILIAEDYEANRMFLGIVLENAGLTYEMAENGVEALEKFKTGKYDLILMDENMPEMNGSDALREILKIESAENRSHTPIVSLTANAFKGDKERILSAGYDDYLSKPVDPNELLTAIGNFLIPTKK